MRTGKGKRECTERRKMACSGRNMSKGQRQQSCVEATSSYAELRHAPQQGAAVHFRCASFGRHELTMVSTACCVAREVRQHSYNDGGEAWSLRRSCTVN